MQLNTFTRTLTLTANIKISGRLTSEIPINKGLKQGCCIAPTLLKIYLNEALITLRKKRSNMSVPIGDQRIYTLHFARDQAIIAEDELDVDYMLSKLEEKYTKWELTSNTQKAEYLVVGGRAEYLQVGKVMIRETENFRYLGVKITRGSNEEINSRIDQARRAIRKLHELLWSSKITKNIKRRIYKTIIGSIGLYGAELCEVNQRNKSKIKALEMDYWRRCCQLTRQN